MTLNPVTHKNIMVRILKDIFADPEIGPALGFKGGTAAYLFYNLNRFSVDLDFDLIDESKEDLVFKKVRKILEGYGTLKQAEKKRFNLFFLLDYLEKVEGAQNVKVEINRRDFDSKYEVKSYLGISMKVMTEADMFAHKLVAMFERISTANRDIFDVYFFLKNNWPINKEIVEKRTNLTFKEFLQKAIVLLEEMGDRSILAGMGELLDEKQKDWARAKLRTETIFLLKLKLEEEK